MAASPACETLSLPLPTPAQVRRNVRQSGARPGFRADYVPPPEPEPYVELHLSITPHVRLSLFTEPDHARSDQIGVDADGDLVMGDAQSSGERVRVCMDVVEAVAVGMWVVVPRPAPLVPARPAAAPASSAGGVQCAVAEHPSTSSAKGTTQWRERLEARARNEQRRLGLAAPSSSVGGGAGAGEKPAGVVKKSHKKKVVSAATLAQQAAFALALQEDMMGDDPTKVGGYTVTYADTWCTCRYLICACARMYTYYVVSAAMLKQQAVRALALREDIVGDDPTMV